MSAERRGEAYEGSGVDVVELSHPGFQYGRLAGKASAVEFGQHACVDHLDGCLGDQLVLGVMGPCRYADYTIMIEQVLEQGFVYRFVAIMAEDCLPVLCDL